MKQIAQKILLVGSGAVIGLAALAPAITSAAGTATLSLLPGSGSYTTGSTISVGIYEDSGSDTVNAVRAYLTYDSSLLSCNNSSISNSSAFGVAAQSTCGSGSVHIDRGAFTPVSGSQLVATINFTASAAGTATVNFAAGSYVVRSTDNGAETLSTSGASYTLSAPAPPPPPPPSGGGSGSGSGSTKSTGGSSSSSSSSSGQTNTTPAPAASAPFTITNVAVSNLSDKSATISWQTSVPTTSEVDYGLNTSYGLSAVDSTLSKNHQIVLDPATLKASSTFHYLIKSTDANHQQVASKDQTFKTLVAVAAKKQSSFPGWLVGLIVFLLLGVGVLLMNYRRKLQHHGPTASPGAGPMINGSSSTIIKPMGGGSASSAMAVETEDEAPPIASE